jgi:hypothetical protein
VAFPERKVPTTDNQSAWGLLKILYFTFTRVLKRRAEINGLFAELNIQRTPESGIQA